MVEQKRSAKKTIDDSGYTSSWQMPEIEIEEILLALRTIKIYCEVLDEQPAYALKLFEALNGLYIIVSPFMTTKEKELTEKQLNSFEALTVKEMNVMRVRNYSNVPFRLSRKYKLGLREIRITLQMCKFKANLGTGKAKVDSRTTGQKLSSYLKG